MTPVVMPSYGRADIAFEYGEGVYLFSTKGDRYLDFASGIAVNALGHKHPRLVKALANQSNKLWHVSNAFNIPENLLSNSSILSGVPASIHQPSI